MCMKVVSCSRDNLQPVTDTLTDASPQSTISWRGMKNSSVKMFRMMQIHRPRAAASTENSFTTADEQGMAPWREGVRAGVGKLRPRGHKRPLKRFYLGWRSFKRIHQCGVSQNIAVIHHYFIAQSHFRRREYHGASKFVTLCSSLYIPSYITTLLPTCHPNNTSALSRNHYDYSFIDEHNVAISTHWSALD